MEREKGFNFRLLVPPLVNSRQKSTVRPQEVLPSSGNSLGSSKCDDKIQNSLPKSLRPDFTKMKIVPPMEKDENNYTTSQVYSKLFVEVEKIKCWKAKVDSDTAQKERKLQDYKLTIESQRKAIQELQFGNETLSVKLEEQISENEDLKNKNNATRNLCTKLKETFQRSGERMQLFESEREETHQLFMENTESIKNLLAAFDSLRIKAESNKQEMQKVKEGLLQFEDLKQKYDQEYEMKAKEIEILQTKLEEKENELLKIFVDLNEKEKQCRQLQESSNQQCELLKSSKNEQDSLLQRLHTAELRCEETEKNQQSIAATLEQIKMEHADTIKSKDLRLQELNRVKNQQAEKLEQMQMNIQELKNSLVQEMQRVKELEDELTANNNKLEQSNALFGEATEQALKKDGLIKTLQDKLDVESNSFQAIKGKLAETEATVEELSVKLAKKTEEIQLLKNEAEMASAKNNLLQAACEASEKAQQDLTDKSKLIEVKVEELEGQLFSEMNKNKEYTFQIKELSENIIQHEARYEELLSNYSQLQSERTAIQQQFENGCTNVETVEANMKVSEQKAVKLKKEIEKLEEKNQCLREELHFVKTGIQAEYSGTKGVQKEIEKNYEHLQKKVTEKEKKIKAVETKVCSLKRTFEIKFKALEEYKKENKMLKKQLENETFKTSELEVMISSLHKESENIKGLKDEDHQKLLKDLESKSTFATELEKEVQELKLIAAEATKSKEDTELKCQHKIADMVALMGKHKSQYDQMFEEKDTELEENKRKEKATVARAEALELDLSKQKRENDKLKEQLETGKVHKENLQKELTSLKKKLSLKITQLSQARSKQSTPNYQQESFSETPRKKTSESSVFDFSETVQTPLYNKDEAITAVIKNTETSGKSFRTPVGTTPSAKVYSGDINTPGSITRMTGGTSKIKSYRIKTPPFTGKLGIWQKSNIELDPKSDSSDHSDILTFANVPPSRPSAPFGQPNFFRKIESPAVKSPRNSLKLSAMKRIREAGWTSVSGSDKKRKTSGKIFN